MGQITVNFSNRLEETIIEKFVRLIAYYDDCTYAQAITTLIGFMASIKAKRNEMFINHLCEKYSIDEAEIEWLIFKC